MFKQLATARIPLATSKLIVSSTSRRSLLQPLKQARFYSSSDKPKGSRKELYGLAILGLAAVGLTYYNLNNTFKPPRESIDPTATKALFKDDEIDVIFVLGGPGSGKGTQCAKLVNNFDFVHLSAGDLLRAEQNTPDSELGELIARYIKDGQIVPMEITIGLLQNAIVKAKEAGKTKFLIDGFPRKMDQALKFESSVVKSKLTLYFECPEEVMLARLLERGKTSGRTDDNLESIKKRFRVFTESSFPVVEYYDDLGKVIKVSCNQPVDEVYSLVVKGLQDKGVTK